MSDSPTTPTHSILPMYDLIGDIHGHADELHALLAKLEYRLTQGVYQHPNRKVIFLGDFIDRGPNIPEVLRTVRNMVERGHALAVMGNHEFNALAYHTPHPAQPGEFLRPRIAKNVHQHRHTLEQLSPADLTSHLNWFRTLPLWLELPELRAVHACWDDPSLRRIAALDQELGHLANGQLTDRFLELAALHHGPLFAPIEVILKGKSTRLPSGYSFADKDGHARHEMRVRWYLPAAEHTYRSYAFQADEIACDELLDTATLAGASPYAATDRPVFVGHYWLSAKQPALLAPNVACLDYSVAKHGFLCAYRWQGEQQLTSENFVWIARD